MKRVLAILFVVILLGAAAAKLVFFDFPKMAGNDMAPAIQAGDWLLVYRMNKQPRRGDLVLIDHPQRPTVTIRRVVALPGETVVVKDEIPVIEGQPTTRKPLGPTELRDRGSTLKMQLVLESFGGARYELLKDPRRRSVNIKPVKLGNAYFVMADNRNHGTDSRTFGPVPAASIRGVVTHRIFAGAGTVGSADRAGWARLE
jgi:signal peptidase I